MRLSFRWPFRVFYRYTHKNQLRPNSTAPVCRPRKRSCIMAPSNFHELKATMSNIPVCPQCAMENTYPDGANYVCADCGYEWPMAAAAAADESAGAVVKDANGNAVQWRFGGVDQGSQGEGFIHHAEGGHQGQEHPLGRWRPRSGLQDGCRQLYAQGLFSEEGLKLSPSQPPPFEGGGAVL